MNRMLTTDEAIATIVENVPTVGVERVLLNDAVGRHLAETIVADDDSPPFDNSAMDGFAVKSGDAGQRRLIGESAAGAPFDGELKPGDAVRIFTGAELPDGADTVVVQEVCEWDDESVTINESVTPRSNIRWRGENIRSGEIVLDVAQAVTPGDIALLSSFRRSVLSVFRRPRVAIVTSGDELREVDQPAEAGSIVNSNAYMLEALVRQSGGEPVVLPIARDTMSDTRRAFADALATADIVVSAGGVSVGDHDVVGLVIEELGTTESHFWKVQMKPGKPLAFARTQGGTPIIGLPGNPISSFVGFHLFVGPAIRVAQGSTPEASTLPRAQGVAASPFRSTPKREHFVMGRHTFDGSTIAFTPFPHQSSGNLRLLRGATALAAVPVGVDRVDVGESIELVLLS